MGSQSGTTLNEAKYKRIHKDRRNYYVVFPSCGIKENARIRVKQDADLVLKNLKLKILGQPYDE